MVSQWPITKKGGLVENGKLAEASKTLNTVKTHDVMVQIDCENFLLGDKVFIKILTMMLDSLFLCDEEKRLEIQRGFIDSLCESHKEIVKHLIGDKNDF